MTKSQTDTLAQQPGKPLEDGWLRREVASIIHRKVRATTHPHFVDRLEISGVTEAAEEIAALAAQPPAAPVETEEALVDELADVAESHFLPTIKAMREALLVAREAIWSGGDTIRAVTAIDAALAHPCSPARTAPESCPHCINEDDCASVDICRAVEEVSAAGLMGGRPKLSRCKEKANDRDR